MFIVIPNLLISIQRDIEIPIEKKNPNEIINTRPPQVSSPYYEDTTGEAYGIYVSGDYAYIADRRSGLAVIDVSDPTNPGTPVYKATTGDARDVYVRGNYAYLADENSGLAVVDVSDRTGGEIPFGNFFLIFIGFSVICLIFTKKRQIVRESDNKSTIQ